MLNSVGRAVDALTRNSEGQLEFANISSLVSAMTQDGEKVVEELAKLGLDDNKGLNMLEEKKVYCWDGCTKSDVEKMVGCDGEGCETEWFHLCCVDLEEVPVGRWFCPVCMKKKEEKQTGRKKKP